MNAVVGPVLWEQQEFTWLNNLGFTLSPCWSSVLNLNWLVKQYCCVLCLQWCIEEFV